MVQSSSLHDADQTAVHLAQEGSPTGLRALYEKYFKAIYRFCYWQTNSSEDAEDLTQEVFLAMTKSLKNFRGEAQFKNWLYQIAKNIVAHWITEKRKLLTVPLLDDLTSSSEWIDPENQKYKEKVVKKLLGNLKQEERKILMYRYLKSYSVKETAEKLKISESKVKVVNHRVLKKLQKLFFGREVL
jgi:RNA polymerase sigma-70 factor (ECF subfamily)